MTTERDIQLRQLLVSQVAERPAPKSLRSIAIVAAIAFVLGGGVVGGAISAAAAVRPHAEQSPPATTLDGPATASSMIAEFLHGGHTAGPLVTYQGSGAAHLDLGVKPADATGIAMYLQCDGTGTLAQSVGGEASTAECDPNTGFGHSSDKPPTDSVVTVSPTRSFAYRVWAQWITVPAPTAPSAAQLAEVADGTVSEAEHDDAIARFSACMYGAGYPITIESTDPALTYSSPSEASVSGAQDRCFGAELSQVEMIWTNAHY